MSLIDNGDGTFTLTEDAGGSVTDVSFVPFYPQWKNSPDDTTPIDAAALGANDAALAAATQRANDAYSAAIGAQVYSDAKTLTGTTAVKTANFTCQTSFLHPVNATAGAVTATLPSASGNAGAVIAVIKTDAGANLVTVTGTINGTASATYHLAVNEGVELLSDGAGSWWLVSSQGADLSGLATQSALNTTNANVTALTTTVNGVSAQQTTLNDTALTIDETAKTWHLQGAWINHVWTEIVSASHERALWPVPFGCQIVACELVADFASIAQSPTNLMTFSLGKRTNATTRTDFVTKSTNDEALTARVAWTLDASVWDPTASVLNKDDFLTVNFGFSGTASLQYPIAITIRYVPTS